MTGSPLATYLNDHLSGAAAVLDLLAYVESAYPATATERSAAALRLEITEDRKALESLMDRLHISQSLPRKASAWIAEKFARLKLKADDTSTGDFQLFEAMEAISVGVEGKRLLWLALSAVASSMQELQALDYANLIERAHDQRERIEQIRITAGQGVLGKSK